MKWFTSWGPADQFAKVIFSAICAITAERLDHYWWDYPAFTAPSMAINLSAMALMIAAFWLFYSAIIVKRV